MRRALLTMFGLMTFTGVVGGVFFGAISVLSVVSGTALTPEITRMLMFFAVVGATGFLGSMIVGRTLLH